MKIGFTINTPYGVYSDALTLPDDIIFTGEEIEAMKQERVQRWITLIETASTEVPVEEPIDEQPLVEPSQEIMEEPPVDQPETVIEEPPVESGIEISDEEFTELNQSE